MGEDKYSSDPFDVGYARSGNTSARDRLERNRNAFNGYGLGPAPGPKCPPTPTEALEECVRAGQSVLANTIQRHQKMPYEDPSFLSRPMECVSKQSVLSTTAAFNAATNASGILLHSANNSSAYPVALLEMGSATDSKVVLTIEAEQSYMVRVKSWGVGFGPSGPKSVKLTVVGMGVGGTPAAPNPMVSGPIVQQHQEAFIILRPKQTIKVMATLVDPAAGPVLVDISVCLWTWAVNTGGDTPEQSILRSGYGRDCK